ncbi:succinylglutamate desuccinylase/aspartoacylase family protein [Sneathiella sp. CAU 1612]|uniref:Succinylglutamate desuccinylase/aspartoacylase family protein n=1 Tax=Sneathiella sedimenti TaxID=2816034 RepID=A0ABS3F0X7_9PROT|nr:succinylglutamate desuccinylase/aspartoacylase family protein [Sneathiella sedimenti]MBO0332165.1 succinylglutamate desuccinylase/aspartoacylase family protein [Sneathiella sedimenti]
MRKPFELAGETIPAGQRRIVDIPLSMMSDHTPATLSVLVIHGKREGPTIFVSAAIHGDEILGVEIIRRLARLMALRRISGTLLLVPIVNMFGFIGQSRYLPDRRDLNRSFPGNAKGSLASRLAHLFLNEAVRLCDFGIDLHTAAIHRNNLPQVRVDLNDKKARSLAEAFEPPVIVNSSLRDGSLRNSASELGIPVMVYEAGEALRFNEVAVRVGVSGVLRVMRHLNMVSSKSAARSARKKVRKTAVATKSAWLRAPDGGLLRTRSKVGDFVHAGDLLGMVSDPFGGRETEVRATTNGLIIGTVTMPLVNQGDALFHIAFLSESAASGASIGAIEEEFESNPLFDDQL